jgi:predicted PurR-regulated permease PerM
MQSNFLYNWYMVSVIAALSVIALIVGKTLLIPLTLGLFLALALTPMVTWLTHHKFPHTLAIVTTFLATLAIVGIIGSVVGLAINDFATRVPEYLTHAQENISSAQAIIFDKLPIDQQEVFDLINPKNLSSLGLKTVGGILTTTGTIAAAIGLTIVVTFLLLLYRGRIKKFFELVADKNQQQGIQTIARKSFSILPRYLLGLMFVIGILSVINSFGFWLIGVPSPLFWGIMVSLLNVIPYVGPFIGFGTVTIFTLVVVGLPTALLAMVMFLVAQFIDNNFLTPIIAGGQISINPLAAIISIIIWGMIWGVIGMVLALPILGLIKIICDAVPKLQPLGYLLGDKS